MARRHCTQDVQCCLAVRMQDVEIYLSLILLGSATSSGLSAAYAAMDIPCDSFMARITASLSFGLGDK